MGDALAALPMGRDITNVRVYILSMIRNTLKRNAPKNRWMRVICEVEAFGGGDIDIIDGREITGIGGRRWR